jgi:glycosyltransferase involved in cell wall biosynthesis
MENMSAKAVIIPAYNAAATIAETLHSVRACRGIDEIGHIFVCDDGSADDTVGCARKAWAGPPALTIVQNKSNLGERRTINAAIQNCKDIYEWIFLLHADDVVKENWVELYLPRMHDADPQVASICSSYDCWYQDTGRIDPGENDFSRDVKVIKGSFETVAGTLKAGCWWHVSGCAIRVPNFIEIGGFRPDMPQLGDFEWLLRCLKSKFDIIYIPRTTMLYRMHANSVSSDSYRIGRDLTERLGICEEYFNEGYLDKRDYRGIRRSVIFDVAKRIAKQSAHGNVRQIPKLLQISRRAIQGARKSARRHSDKKQRQ